MRLLYICFVLILTTCTVNSDDTSSYTFKFGVNEGRLTFAVDGSMGIYEKNRKVPVLVPECSALKYVQVDVYNPLGPPAVNFDWTTKTVEISYGLFHAGLSKYTVVAKTEPMTFCAFPTINLLTE